MSESSQRERDARITADRRELKFWVGEREAGGLGDLLDHRLSQHSFVGGNAANDLPDARHYVTTVYFDTADRAVYQECQAGRGASVKIRAKEYYDLHTSLRAVAARPDALVRDRVLWLEIKHRDGQRTRKQRFGVPRSDLASFFRAGTISPEMVEIQRLSHGEEAERVLAEVSDVCSRYGQPLEAVALVNYRRRAWQDEDAQLRVTLDSDLAIFEPPADLWERDLTLVRPTLGEPVLARRGRIVEVKLRDEIPEWLESALQRFDAGPAVMASCGRPFSKFLAASEAVRPRREAAA